MRSSLRPRAVVAPVFAGGPLAFFGGFPEEEKTQEATETTKTQTQEKQQGKVVSKKSRRGRRKAGEEDTTLTESNSSANSANNNNIALGGALIVCAVPDDPSRLHVVDCSSGKVLGAESSDVSSVGALDGLSGSSAEAGDNSALDAFEERGEQVTALCFSQNGREVIAGFVAGVPLVRRYAVVRTPPTPAVAAVAAADGANSDLGSGQDEVSGGLRLLSQWRGHTGPICAAVADGSGTLVATAGAGKDQSVRVWQVTPGAGAEPSTSGHSTHHLPGHGRGGARVLAFHPDPAQALLFAASNEGEIRAWNLLSRQCVLMKEHFADVSALCFSPRSSDLPGSIYDLVSVGRDRVACVWNVEGDISLKKTFSVGEVAEGACCFPDGTLGVTGGEGGRIRLFDVTSGGEVPDPSAGDDDSNIRGTEVVAMLQASLPLRAGGARVCVVNSDSHLVFFGFDAQDRSLREQKLLVGTNDEVIDAKFVEPRGGAPRAGFPRKVVIATNSNDARVFSLDSGACQLVRGHTDITLCVDVSPGLMLATGSKDGDVRLWKSVGDDAPWRCKAVLQGHTEAVVGVGFARKSDDWVASTSSDRTLKIWHVQAQKDTVTAGCTHTVSAHDKDVNHITVAPNDRLIATSSQDKTAKLWSVSRGKGGVPTAELHGVLRGHRRGVWSSAFSPVDQVVATASSDKSVRLWRATDCSCLKTFQGHQTGVLSVAFLSHGMQLFSAAADGLANLWTIKTGECVNTFDGGHTDRVWAIAVPSSSDAQSEEDRRAHQGVVPDIVLTAGSDGLIMTWDDITEALVRRERDRADKLVQQEQQLDLALQKKQWDKAIRVAFALDQPARLLAICDAALHAPRRATDSSGSDAAMSSDGELPGRALLREVVRHKLFKYKLERALGFVREWNANSRHAHTAQEVLRAILDVYPPEELSAVPNIQGLLEGLMPYTARHFKRVSSLVQQTYVLDFLCDQIRLTAPERELRGTSFETEGAGADNHEAESHDGSVQDVVVSAAIAVDDEDGHDSTPEPSRSRRKTRPESADQNSSKRKGRREKKGKHGPRATKRRRHEK
jgi:U3 small nucleolar RNA-associated protein 13